MTYDHDYVRRAPSAPPAPPLPRETEEAYRARTHTAAGLTIKDSGRREEMPTGSRRDSREGKGRFDLIPPYAIELLAKQLEAGALKYGDRNWEKGQPVSRFADSGLRHLIKWMRGDTDEDHLTAALWNVACAADTRERIRLGVLPDSLADMPPKAGEHACPVCGMKSERRGVCSEDCGRARKAAYAREAYQKTSPRAVECEDCGVGFFAKQGPARRCEGCRRKAGKAEKRRGRHRRRFRIAGGKWERFDPLEIFRRDDWVCRLCGKACDRDAVVPNHLAATLDHVIPVSRGGEHTRDNTQCAHFICNSRKGNDLHYMPYWHGN